MAKPRFLHKFNVCEHPMTTAIPPITPEFLARWVPLGSLGPDTREELTRKTHWIERPAGAFLFRSGEALGQALFLESGQIELSRHGGAPGRLLQSGTAESLHRIPASPTAEFDARCVTPVRCIAIDRQLIDMLLTWEQSAAAAGANTEARVEEADEADDDWMLRLLQTPAFLMIPPAHLQAMFMRMQTVEAVAGQVILRQDEEGDYFYVITHGRCIVTRQQPPNRPIQLAQLEVGACFGEEALISDAPRNATVTMLTRGTLKRLSKQDFRQLLNEPLARRLSWTEAEHMVEQGRARLVDVRLPSEFHNRSLPGSLNLPLYLLRMRLNQLDPQLSWICVCDTGRRSSVASFLLMHRGYDAYILAQGMPPAN